jgi:hypothetical protein
VAAVDQQALADDDESKREDVGAANGLDDLVQVKKVVVVHRDSNTRSREVRRAAAAWEGNT